MNGAPPPLPDASRLRGVVFDLDGTLIDSYRAIHASLNHARGSHGLTPLPLDVVRNGVGHGLESLVAEWIGPEHVASGVRAFRERYAEVYSELTTSLPEVEPTLRKLCNAGLALSVASNKPARFGEAILEDLGLRELFRSVQGPDTAGVTKPDPAMIEACLDAMGASRDEAVYVGDMELDVESGSRAGLPVILVPGGSCAEADLRATGRPVIADLGELPAALGF